MSDLLLFIQQFCLSNASDEGFENFAAIVYSATVDPVQ